jgi:hypothetical protein
MSVPAADLDQAGRDALCEFYGDVLGFVEHPTMTEDKVRLVLGAHGPEQFVYVVAEDEPMAAHQHDHYGLSVATKDDFDAVARRAAAWKERLPGEVTFDGPFVEEHASVLRLHNLYLAYRLPLTVEVQYFEWLAGAVDGSPPE